MSYNEPIDTKENKTIKPTLKPIDIPIDFKELITLQPLITQIEVFELLKKNLDEYRWNYFKSHQYTATQVLSIIPEDQWDEYFNNTLIHRENCDFKTLPEFLKYKYTFVNKYASFEFTDINTGKEITVKNRETYIEEKQDIIIDTINRKLYFVLHDLQHGHQYYGRETIYHLKKNILTIEFKWSFVPWYSNRQAPTYFSHYYKFDLKTDKIVSVNINEMKS